MIKNKIQLVTFLIIVFFISSCGINNIPTYDEAAVAAWSEVLNQYKRRADLIPNLMETVKGAAANEKDILNSVIEARAKATQTQLPKDILSNPEAFKQFQANQDALSSALSKLMVVVERYPDIKSNQNFLSLQSQLEGAENRIAIARRDYINAVKRYNTELRTIPGRWWKSLMYSDSQPKQNFSAPDSVQDTPNVDFSKPPEIKLDNG
jgi:LemA protein